jgi:AraC-like DNA-binding protein
MNVSQWINKRRIDEVAAMLRDTEKSVSEIYKLCGFRSRSNFDREFQRIHGCTPGTFRANHD